MSSVPPYSVERREARALRLARSAHRVAVVSGFLSLFVYIGGWLIFNEHGLAAWPFVLGGAAIGSALIGLTIGLDRWAIRTRVSVEDAQHARRRQARADAEAERVSGAPVRERRAL